MTSKQLVKNAIHFKGIDRVPINFNISEVISPISYDDDIIWASLDPNPDFTARSSNNKRYENEWGVVFESINTAIGEAAISPIKSPEDIADYEIPDLGAAYRFETAKKTVHDNPDKYVLGVLGASNTAAMLFMLLLDLFGFEECMVNLALYQEEVEGLISRITDQHIRSIEGFAKAGVNGIIAGDDLGLQDRLIISPDMWRAMFKPYYKKIIDAVHRNNLDMMLHICGNITEIIEDLIEIGLDVLQIDQQDNMGIEILGERYKGRITFFCPVDIQTTLCTGELDKIKEKAIQLLNCFGSSEGGFLAKMYPQPSSIGISRESMETMCRTFIEYGKY